MAAATGAYLHGEEIVWVAPTYHAVHNTLTHPAYAGAYVYGRTRFQRRLGTDGTVRTHRRVLPRDQWQVLIPDHHQGFISWEDYLANQDKIGSNTRPRRHQPGTGAVREGCALLQGLATCGTCGRKLAVFYQGPAKATPGYYCTGSGQLVQGRGTRHLQVGGQAIDAAVADAFLAALTPAALDACLQAADQLEAGHDAALAPYRREVERARYDASRTERRYRAVDPDNRLVARGLEADWEIALTALGAAESELARRQRRRPSALTPAERATILALADDLATVWTAQTTTDKDRKQLLHTLLEDVTLAVHRDDPDPHAQVLIRWKGGATSELTVPIRRPQPKIRTDEATVDLIRRLAVHYPDAQIAGILNRQGRRTARGLSYTASRVQGTRHYWGIPCHEKSTGQQEGELVTGDPRRRRTRPCALHPAPLAGRRLHRRRAGHPRRPLAHPPHRPAPRAVRRGRARRLAGHAGGHPRLRRLPPDLVAACQARRAARRPRPHRTQEGPAYRATDPPGRPVLTLTMNERSSVAMHPNRL